MSMEKINAIDLDKTLISFDSFKKLVLLHLNVENYLTIVLLYTLLRKFRFISSHKYKSLVIKYIVNNEKFEFIKSQIINDILNSLDNEVIELVKNKTDKDTTNIIVSASPSFYVKFIAEELKWEYISSEFYSEEFIHCYGTKKIDLIKQKYPMDKYIYNFAISDSKSDLPMLESFRDSLLI